MEMFGNLWFFVYVFVAAIPAIIMGIFEKNSKYYLLASSIVFVVWAMKDSPKAIIFLVGYLIWQYILIKTYTILRKKVDRNKWIYFSFLICSLAPLVVNKVAGCFGTSILGFLGISYLTFKSVQMVIEVYDGLIKEIRGEDLISFLIFFPAITSGPIDRSRRFQEDLANIPSRKEYLDLLGEGLFKIVKGVLYKFVFAAAFYQGVLWIGNGTSLKSSLAYMYCYGPYLFFDFAGYSLMAIGVSYMFGIKTPENFNMPFISKDIKEFWDRWHMTLSYWFRDYLFSRFMMNAIRNKWFKTKLQGASVGFILNMTVMGIWHGLSCQYILYGAYHGVLLAVTEIYQKKSKFHKKHKKEKLYVFVSWAITINLVMFGFFIFSGRFTELIGV